MWNFWVKSVGTLLFIKVKKTKQENPYQNNYSIKNLSTNILTVFLCFAWVL